MAKTNIAIIDADLIGKPKHRFPNLACMKISSYYKSIRHCVELIYDYKNLYIDENIWTEYQTAISNYIKKQTKETNDILVEKMIPCFKEKNIKYDKIFISKVFGDTEIDADFLQLDIVEYGGTGFYFNEDGVLKQQPPNLPDYIEHIMPDYTLYDKWINEQVLNGANIKEFKFYQKYSIGFTTRGCFRKCWFCVNKYCDKSILHSPIYEFLNKDKPYVLLLDDNMLACKDWKSILTSLQLTNKKFQYKQGLDERLLTKEKCKMLFLDSKYHEDFIFAFDNYLDKEIIEEKLEIIREVYPSKSQNIKFYVFCAGKNPKRKYNDFWIEDIIETFERIKILSKYNCFPYIMRFKDWKMSPYKGMYSNLAAWCNQPQLFKKMSFRQFCIERGMKYSVYKQYKGRYDDYLQDGYKKGATWRYMDKFELMYPDIAKRYFDMKFEELNQYL